MFRWLLLAIALVLAAMALFPSRSPAGTRPPGIVAPDPPRQRDEPSPPIPKSRYTLNPVARFESTALVLSRADYRFDTEAALAPTDLVLGWGRMSDSNVLAALTITQAGRWYRYWYRNAPIPPHEIATSSANMHFIPADDAVARELARVRAGDVVELRGRLVDATRPDGWRWYTSRRRDDTGHGACELVYLESIAIR